MLAIKIVAIVSGVVGLLASIVSSSACCHSLYTTGKNSFLILEQKVKDLKDLLEETRRKLSENGVLRPDPSQWIIDAEKSINEDNIVDLGSRLHESCISGVVPNICNQCGTWKSIETKIREVSKLQKEGEKLKLIGVRQSSTMTIVGSDFEATKEQIWKELSEENIQVVCITGLVGVGKTVMASAIHDKALKEMNELENVIWVSIKHESDTKDIQEGIARQLCLDISALTDVSSRALKLHGALTSKKVFLVLDYIPFFQDFELGKIGIPESGDNWKLIVASSSYAACRKLKGRFGNRSRIRKIEPLSEDEGWKLFVQDAGPNIGHIKDKIRKDTEMAVKNADGLPSAIRMLAQDLKEIPDNNPTRICDAWNKELFALSSSGSLLGNKSQKFFDGYRDTFIKLGEVAVSCFLYCLLFPKGNYVLEEKELIEHWMWEGLLGEVSSLEETKGDGKEVLDNLSDAHLLEIITNKGEGGRDEVSVKMLNVLRLVAMDALKSRHRSFFIDCANSLKKLPAALEWPADTERASFIQNEVHALQFGPYCKNLSTLLLQHNPLDNFKSHNKFFSNLVNLRVLDLSHTRISLLPKSLSALENLRALLLNNCQKLTSLPSLSKLQNLLVLDLSRTPLKELPRGLNDLTNLRRLDLSQMTKLQSFRAEEIGKLTRIEELLLIANHGANLTWVSNQISPVWRSPCIEELVALRRLVVLQLNFLDSAVFRKFLETAEFEKNAVNRPEGARHSFKFCVGDPYNGDHVLADNSLIVSDNQQITLPEETTELHWIRCAKKLPSLQIDGCFNYLTILDVSEFKELEYVLTWEMLMNLEKLKEIHIKQCHKTVSIIKSDVRAKYTEVIIPDLTTIVLYDLPMLDRICDYQVLNAPSLQRVDVSSCGILKLPQTVKGGKENLIIKGDKDWLENVKKHPPNFTSTFTYEETSSSTAASTSQGSVVITEGSIENSLHNLPEDVITPGANATLDSRLKKIMCMVKKAWPFSQPANIADSSKDGGSEDPIFPDAGVGLSRRGLLDNQQHFSYCHN